MLKKTVIWGSREGFGSEYLELTIFNNEIKVNSTVIFLDDHSPYKVDFQVWLNHNWEMKQLDVSISNGKSLRLSSDGKGRWFDIKGQELHDLSGAIDIDLSCTPFTNSLPINRKKWRLDQPQEFEMVFISVPDLAFRKVHQSYEWIQKTGEKRKFCYRSDTYETVLEVDSYGLVVDYPEVFTRMY